MEKIKNIGVLVTIILAISGAAITLYSQVQVHDVKIISSELRIKTLETNQEEIKKGVLEIIKILRTK